MKKIVLPLTIILLVVSILCVLLVNKPQKFIKDSEKYKSITVDEISKIELSYQTLLPIDDIQITNKDEIKAIYSALGNIQILDKKGVKVTDAGLIITIYKEEPVFEFVFEGEYYQIDDDNYETKGRDKLDELLAQYISE